MHQIISVNFSTTRVLLLSRSVFRWQHLLTRVLTCSPPNPSYLTFPPCFRLQQLMHAIVMVHKMQRMALSSHHLLPAAGAEKADSENTRNSENNDDEAKGEEDCQQGERGSKLNQLHTNTELNRKQNRIGKHTPCNTHTNTLKTQRHKNGQANTRGRKDTFCMLLCTYYVWTMMSSTFTVQMHLALTKSDTVL